MKELTLSGILRVLASGINPETGEMLPDFVSVHKHTKKAYLLKLADEVEHIDDEIKRRSEAKKNPRWKPWLPDEENSLREEYNSNLTVSNIAEKHDRSETAIALRLIQSGIVSQEEIFQKLPTKTKEKVENVIQREEKRKRSKMQKRGS
ncbi:hypothetical protein AG28_25270 [Salmonella enterica subsp. enterica]|nr:hypothetical protein [Salmonella enterica subsp. enterica]